jgi:hypothetical protein
MAERVFLTKHAKARLQERHDRWLDRYTNEAEFERSCLQLLSRAQETKRFLNDTAFMTRMHERYGYDAKFAFRVFENVLFVITDRRVVTVLDTQVHATSGHFKPAHTLTDRHSVFRLQAAKALAVQRKRKHV